MDSSYFLVIQTCNGPQSTTTTTKLTCKVVNIVFGVRSSSEISCWLESYFARGQNMCPRTAFRPSDALISMSSVDCFFLLSTQESINSSRKVFCSSSASACFPALFQVEIDSHRTTESFPLQFLLFSSNAFGLFPSFSSFCLFSLLHFSSFLLIPPHSSSLLLIPFHSSSFLLIPFHSSSFLLIPPHSSSFLLTPPHSSSFLLHSSSFFLWLNLFHAKTNRLFRSSQFCSNRLNRLNILIQQKCPFNWLDKNINWCNKINQTRRHTRFEANNVEITKCCSTSDQQCWNHKMLLHFCSTMLKSQNVAPLLFNNVEITKCCSTSDQQCWNHKMLLEKLQRHSGYQLRLTWQWMEIHKSEWNTFALINKLID